LAFSRLPLIVMFSAFCEDRGSWLGFEVRLSAAFRQGYSETNAFSLLNSSIYSTEICERNLIISLNQEEFRALSVIRGLFPYFQVTFPDGIKPQCTYDINFKCEFISMYPTQGNSL